MPLTAPARTAGQPIRVLRVLPWIVSGGVEKRALMLARLLNPSEVEQRIITMDARDPLKAEIEAAGVPIEVAGKTWGPRDLSATVAIRRAIARFSPHIVHAGVFEATYHASLACLSAPGVRLVLDEIDYPIRRSWRGDMAIAAMYARADAVVAVSEAVGTYIREKLRPGDKLRTITNGVERARQVRPEEAAALRAELGIPAEAKVVITVGRMHEEVKRMSTLIEAFSLMADSQPNLHVLIVGDGQDRGQLEALAEARCPPEHRGRLRFCGYQRDVPRYLAASDIYALTSRYESFGQALVEAMQAGLPIVSTAIGGPAEIVIPYRTGLVVPVSDPLALKEALLTLLSKPALCEKMGREAEARAEALYSAERYAENTMRLYEELCPAL